MKFNIVLWTLLSMIQMLDAQPEEVWRSIFNGENLKGWTLQGGNGRVRIEDGQFVLQQTANTAEHTFVRTKKKYRDFILELECKRDPTFFYGILFRAQQAPDTAHTRLYGYQIKADHRPDRRWTGGIFDDFGNTWNWMYTLENDPRAQEARKEAGQWDHYRVEAIADHIKVWLNGVPTTNMRNSKYEKGYIALKIHFLGDRPEQEKAAAWIKNVRMVTSSVQRYQREMDIPMRVVN
ncbi:MAG: DUF1080 domain-containing protein [Saprospiraceae bacterium]|nr:DUF1080 domain-containing protein [Saprospiraceae bacterium]